MTLPRPLRLGIVAGEESGDLLAADLVQALSERSDHPVELVGVGGRHLEQAGLASLFDGADIALMGLSSVIRDLPRLMRRINQTADHVVRSGVDCLVTVDSPEFSLRVAKKVRAADPSIPIVHYVCPSVWAWRPGRAPAMKPFVDRILCVLPFEPDALRRLNGPMGTFVGHRLVSDRGLAGVREERRARGAPHSSQKRHLLVLPGSRRSEVRRLIGRFEAVVDQLARRGHRFQVTIPTVPHVADLVRASTAGWRIAPHVVEGQAEKHEAFARGDAAIAASGTVLLELALAGVPMMSCYALDGIFAPLVKRMVTVWSAALPNLVADWPVVPEFYDDMMRPAYLAREIEQLWSDTPTRAAQLAGFAQIAERMETDLPAGELAAAAVLDVMKERGGAPASS